MTKNQQLITSAKSGSASGGKNLLPRPPIVVVMGHVDHGKTTLLDYIRKTTVASKEAGGITQSIGAYEIEHSGKKITFIDTPGHEAFSRMRERGANLADLAILIVAADDGVQPQTKEVIGIIKETKTPFVVAINKIDKNNADPERVKGELAKEEVFLEGYGGNISWQGISAKTGEGVNELLDFILLAAELEGLTYDPSGAPCGVVIEARMESRRGLEVVVILKNGTLRIGDEIKTQTVRGKVKILENFLRKGIKEILPSAPAVILGFESLPQVGEEFCGSKDELAAAAEKIAATDVGVDSGSTLLNVFLKADVSGSLEVLSQIIKAMPETKVVREAIGDITDGDVKEASSFHSAIIGFNVGLTKTGEGVAKAQKVEVITSKIIYELIKKIEEKIQTLRTPPPDGELTVLAIFSQKGKKQLIGGKVGYGIMKKNTRVKVGRGEEEVGMGKITNLQKGKQEAFEAKEGEECGIMFESDITIQVGDKLIYQPSEK
ncbi:MAG: GTP-binding protein [Candidatus Wolfebacteria bacterium]|nr:GTP-binding protein [Candidatus Wolfebacteria bacterium]